MSALTHSDFDAAFREGTRFVDNDRAEYSVQLARLGHLTIESGRVALGDPFTGLTACRPPRGELPKGTYACEVSLLKTESEHAGTTRGDVRIAAAKLRVADKPVVRWVEADVTAEVDSGTCAFADGDADQWAFASESDSQALEDALQLAVLGPSALGTRFASGEKTLCAFSSGLGDGAYGAWWGMTADGTVACLCYDFELLLTPTTSDVTLSLPLRRGAIDDAVLTTAGIKARVPFFAPRQLVIERSGSTWAHVRWLRPDGVFQRPTVKPGHTLKRQVIDLSEPPAGASLVIRLTTGQKQMAIKT